MQWLLIIILMPYVYLLLKIYASLIKIKPYQPGSNPELFVSVIAACRNEEKNLPLLLSDMAAQDYDPGLFELIIVDDSSTDSTYKIASAFNGMKNLKVLGNSGSGKKKAVKTGVEACAGELVISTDADCRLGRSWLKTIASFYSENKPEMIIGPVELKGGRGFFQRFQELEFLSLQGVTAGTTMAGNPVMCNGANLAFTKESYQYHSGNLHEEKISGDDVFLLHSIKKETGSKISWLESQEAVVTTLIAESVDSFLRQRARWISKAGAYADRFTQILAIVTFVTILLQLAILAAGILNPDFLLVFLAVFLIKSVPDFLVLRNTTSRYGKNNLMRWFLLSQIIYPLYVIAVVICSFIRGVDPRTKVRG